MNCKLLEDKCSECIEDKSEHSCCGSNSISTENYTHDTRYSFNLNYNDLIGIQSSIRDSTYSSMLVNTINEHNTNVVQVYNGDSRSYNRRTSTKNDLIKAKGIISNNSTKLFIHASNVVFPASIKHREEVSKSLLKDLEVGSILGCTTLTHIGGGDIDETNCYLSSLPLIITDTNPYPLILENCAEIRGKKTSKKLGGSIDELAKLVDGVKGVGVCIDTQHLFSHGEYNISNPDEVDKFFVEFDSKIGLDKLRLIHLNDSKVPFSWGSDRHSSIGEGCIWNDSFESLQRLLQYTSYLSIPIVLEEYKSDVQQLDTVRQIYNTLR